MNTKNLLKSVLLTVSSTTLLTAFASNPPIPCPPIEFVQRLLADVNTVQFVKTNDYTVYSGRSFYDSPSRLKWLVGTEVYTHDFNTAYDAGKNNIQAAAYQASKFAEYYQDFWLCLYSDDHKTAVYLLSKINDPIDLMQRVLSNLPK